MMSVQGRQRISGRKIIYSGCQWSAIGETGKLGAMVVEMITIMAAKRIETAA